MSPRGNDGSDIAGEQWDELMNAHKASDEVMMMGMGRGQGWAGVCGHGGMHGTWGMARVVLIACVLGR